METKILFQDSNMLVVVKPSGVPSQPDKTGDIDITTFLEKEHGCTLNAISRLDRPVGGIMVFAKNEKAAANLSLQTQNKEMGKEYLAVVCGEGRKDEEVLTDFLLKNQRLNTSAVVNKGVRNGKESKLHYKVIKTIDDENFGQLTLVRVKLYTGRHHQIRVQLANAGMPLWGDTKYNPSFKRVRGKVSLGLFSTLVSLKHPVTGKELRFIFHPREEIFEKFI